MNSIDSADAYVSDFRKRWSMTQVPAEAIEDFRNRAFGSIKEALGGLILDDSSISNAFLHALAEPYTPVGFCSGLTFTTQIACP